MKDTIGEGTKMSLLPTNGVGGSMRGTMKRHSLADIADAWKGLSINNARRGSMTSCRMSVGNALDCAARHEFLESIQVAIVQLFQKKPLQECELVQIQDSVRNLVESEAGPLIYDFFKDKLLKKGMVILREFMKNDLGLVLLKKMSDQWNYFYTQILPTLQAMLYPLPNKDVSIRKVTMLEFRDVVVLKVGIEDTLNSVAREDVPTQIIQMFLVLQGIHDGFPPSENYARLERLAAKVINPYLGFFGFYEGSSKPTIESSLKPTTKVKHLEKTEAYELDIKTNRPKSTNPLVTKSLHHHRHAHGHLFSHILEPLVEQDTVRRHSIDTSPRMSAVGS
nr:proline-rich protein 5 isoform X2 [Crassostrea gigas]XP_034334165.1 proline-rich protein 5 isoform X2 [Crassostrea gigas]XP_034334166.1 proline-rich protein 5 isoform X2 [Crassostrea gigas]XP_034334167.1 proline-rich protein 5 isoform X2 [Crassostrea gigas]